MTTGVSPRVAEMTVVPDVAAEAAIGAANIAINDRIATRAKIPFFIPFLFLLHYFSSRYSVIESRPRTDRHSRSEVNVPWAFVNQTIKWILVCIKKPAVLAGDLRGENRGNILAEKLEKRIEWKPKRQ